MFGTREFIEESNRIEGIHRPPTEEEIAEHERFIGLDDVTIADLERFVSVYQPGAELRGQPGMDIQIGGHRLFGGPHVIDALNDLLTSDSLTPHEAHVQYELLHPFMDGNGRSGRILWLWQMTEAIGSAPLGFLHHFYYQTLGAAR